MSNTEELENALNPVTALAFLKLNRLYLIAGEGHCIKIFEHQTGTPLSRHRIFESETIHGILCCVSDNEEQKNCARLLLWGGRSLCLIELSSKEPTMVVPLCFNVALAEVRTEDWILDVCFNPLANEAKDQFSTSFEAVLVTAHNQLRRLRFPYEKSWEIQNSIAFENSALHTMNRLSSRSNSMLYSAHISWSREDHAEGRILVAAGTVFGEVHLWSSKYDEVGKLGGFRLHYTFTGHLGSVFGVQIAEKVDLMNGSLTRLLASCSDDRTIRVWDISELKMLHSAETSAQCLAITMAHTSRIWAVRFLDGQRGIPQLLSFGEDGTAQAWLFQPLYESDELEKAPIENSFKLTRDAKYHYHSGKHIWAVTLWEEDDGNNLVATGGADGRIVSYRRDLADSAQSRATVPFECTMESVAKTFEITAESTEAVTKKKAVFSALQGQWSLSRTLQSALPTYPSGTFDGVANIEGRPATDPDFNEECLYSEEGEFVVDKVFTIKATRQYVYRYQQKVDELTAWFVKPEGHGLVDHLFHCLDFTKEVEERHEGKPKEIMTILTAKAHHLCINDDYTAEYRFIFVGERMEEWQVKYVVKGPQKDYVADATYSRSAPVGECVHVGSPSEFVPEANGTMQHGPTKIDSFKNYAWVSNTEFLTTTDQGLVLIGTVNAECSIYKGNPSLPALAWESLGQISDLASSSVVTSIPSLGAAFLIGANGKVFSYNSRTKMLKFAVVRQQKPVFIRAQEIDIRINENGNDKYGDWGHVFGFADVSKSQRWISLVTTSLASDRAVISLHASEANETSSADYQFSIQLPKSFIVTSSRLLNKGILVILGSRNGDLFIYDPLREFCKVGTSSSGSIFAGIHGREAITDIQVLPESYPTLYAGTSWILTTGRDGRIAVHQISFSEIERRNSKPELKTYHESTPPFGPNIEGAHFDIASNDLFLWGFHSKEFVVWNEIRKTGVMNIECGGAHRHWAYSPLDDGKGGGSFVWTKASVCKVHKQAESSHRVLQAGGHGREMKAVAIAPDQERPDGPVRQLVATGAEDTAIRIFEYEPASGYRCFRVITKHTTGLQKLQWSGNHDQYLFSAAGCEEFFIWEILRVPRVGIGITCRLVCPAVTPDKDLRIMDFAVLNIRNSGPAAMESISSIQLIAMIYSDSSVRIFAFRNILYREYTLTPLLEGSYATHCLTQVIFISLSSKIYLCTASTDGYLAFWPLNNVLADHGFHMWGTLSMFFDQNMCSDSPAKTFSWQKRFPVHQNSVKGLIHVQLSPKEYLIVTCGDDQALALINITAQDGVSADHDLTHAVLLLPNAHASAVTALTYLGNDATEMCVNYDFASVGNDQQLNVWEVIDDMRGEGIERFKLRRKTRLHTSVADASALEAFAVQDGGPYRFCIAGIGMETWCIGGKMLVVPEE